MDKREFIDFLDEFVFASSTNASVREPTDKKGLGAEVRSSDICGWLFELTDRGQTNEKVFLSTLAEKMYPLSDDSEDRKGKLKKNESKVLRRVRESVAPALLKYNSRPHDKKHPRVESIILSFEGKARNDAGRRQTFFEFRVNSAGQHLHRSVLEETPTASTIPTGAVRRDPSTVPSLAPDALQLLFRFVCELYGDYPLLRRSEWTYPCAIFPASLEQCSVEPRNAKSIEEVNKQAVDSILEHPLLPPLSSEARDTFVRDDEYRTIVKPNAWDGNKFGLVAAQTKENISIQCRVGRFFDIMDTCDQLRHELFKVWSRKGVETKIADLPLRNRLHSLVHDPIRSGANRFAGIAVATVICFLQDGKYSLLLRQRSSQKGTMGADEFHVIPAGFFEPSPTVAPPDVTYSIFETVFREYVEELFFDKQSESGQNEPYWYKTTHVPDEVKHPTLIPSTGEIFYPGMRLSKLINEGRATIHVTGLTVNLLNLRPEVCTLLLFRDSEWANVDLPLSKANWEYHDGRGTGSQPDATVVKWVPIDTRGHELENEYLAPENMVPPGAAALWLGLDEARRQLGMPPLTEGSAKF